MQSLKRWIIVLLVGALLTLAGSAAAQDEPAGTLTLGQPALSQIVAAGDAVQFQYSLAQPSRITLQALSDAVQPTVVILRDGAVVAEQPNTGSQSLVLLSTVLDAGDYIVEIGALGGTTGTVIALIQEEQPVTITELLPGGSALGEVSSAQQVALYSFTALGEPAYLYLDSADPTAGVAARLLNTTTGQISAVLDRELTGARLSIPATGSAYRLQVTHSGGASSEQFVLCFVAVSVGACGELAELQTAVEVAAPADSAACTVTPIFAGGANIRQSNSTNSPILASLPGGASANVLGIAPDGFWYNIEYNGIIGWAALSAVNPVGSCAGLQIVAPPPVAPTQGVPAPTAAPAQPTQPAQPAPTSTPAGPCLIRFSAPELLYTQPMAEPGNIFDQITGGGEAIPVGRYNANGQDWWKTNYGGAWWLNAAGTAGMLQGDCSQIPFITP